MSNKRNIEVRKLKRTENKFKIKDKGKHRIMKKRHKDIINTNIKTRIKLNQRQEDEMNNKIKK